MDICGTWRNWNLKSAPLGPPRTALAPIFVVEPDDVVLAEVVSGLHLDDMQGLGRPVCQPAPRADRNVGGLAGLQFQCFFAAGHRGGA